MDFGPGRSTNGMWHLAAAARKSFLRRVLPSSTASTVFTRASRAKYATRTPAGQYCASLVVFSAPSGTLRLRLWDSSHRRLNSGWNPRWNPRRHRRRDRVADRFHRFQPVVAAAKFNCATRHVIQVLIALRTISLESKWDERLCTWEFRWRTRVILRID